MNKICINCNVELPISNFYTFKKKDLTTVYYRKCSKCHKNYQKKPTGIKKLKKQIQEELMEDSRDRSLNIKEIANKHSLNYTFLLRYIHGPMYQTFVVL